MREGRESFKGERLQGSLRNWRERGRVGDMADGSQRKRREVGEDDTDGWAPSVRERGRGAGGVGLVRAAGAGTVPGRPRLPLFFIFFLLLSFSIFLISVLFV
jgi:hypothetical protein